MQQISAFESATLFSCVCVFLSHPVVDGKCLFKEEADFYEILNITSFQVWLLCVQATPADGLCRWRGPNGCLQPKHVQWTRALQVSRDVFPPLRQHWLICRTFQVNQELQEEVQPRANCRDLSDNRLQRGEYGHCLRVATVHRWHH